MTFRRLPGDKHRRFRALDVLFLGEECDRRQKSVSVSPGRRRLRSRTGPLNCGFTSRISRFGRRHETWVS